MLNKSSIRLFILVVFSLLSNILSIGQTDAKQRIEVYFQNHPEIDGFNNSSSKNWEITQSTSNKKNGLIHHYIRQTIQDLPVLNGTAVIVEKDNKLLLSGNRLILGTHLIQPYETNYDGVKCFVNVWEELTGEKISSGLLSTVSANGQLVIAHPHISNEFIPIRKAYFFDKTSFRAVFEMNMKMTDGLHWWNLIVDAQSGQILEKNNWTLSCQFENCPTDLQNHSQEGDCSNQNDQQLYFPPAPPPQNDSYRVFPLPIESPSFGSRSLIIGPFNSLASPYGWHDTNGNVGAEYTITRGNNVYASDDIDANNVAGYSPDGGSNLIFDFSLGIGSPGTFLDASITNLFYINNVLHDLWYQYGFDEQNGNFQQNNYGNGGLENDYVIADAQDGAGTNNANFSTPPDGSNPRMQLYLWTDSPTANFLEINTPSTLAGSYLSSTSSFGPYPPNIPITADIIKVNSGGAEPMDACNTIINWNEVTGKIALVKRGTCSFTNKVENCQNAGAVGVVIINDVSTAPITMPGTPTITINIPTIMISQNDGNSILAVLNNSMPVNGNIINQPTGNSIDGSYDNWLIAHEYGHGISNRLTGGPSNTNCLDNEDQMGEGWSDWMGLMLTIQPGDLGSDARSVGTYVQNQPISGPGIRTAPYSTDFLINGFTYDATNNGSLSIPYGVGFVWCTALWDLTWDFIEQYGFDANQYTGTGGNNKIMEIVIEAMKLQPCHPGAVDGRDAILLADQLLNNGINECLIWRAFAKRGLGFNASQGDPDNRFDQFENFNLPLSCVNGLNETNFSNQITIYPNPTEDKITILSSFETITKIKLLDVNGRIHFQQSFDNQTNISVDTKNLESGIYVIMLESSHSSAIHKIVKK